MNLCLNRATAGAGLSMAEFADLAAAAGFPGADVDVAFGVEQGASALRDLYEQRRLAFGGWGLRFDWRTDAAGPASLEKQAAIAAELKIDACATHILPASDLPLHQNWHLHVQKLAPIAKILADYGLRFGLEFVAPYHLRRKWPHEFIFTPMAMLELAAEVGPNCGLLVDTFHLHAAGEPMSMVGKIPAAKIVLVHINDAPPGPIEELQDKNRLLPGRGVIDLPGFLAALHSTGYAGPISVEVFSDHLKSLSPLAAAKEAWQATNDAVA